MKIQLSRQGKFLSAKTVLVYGAMLLLCCVQPGCYVFDKTAEASFDTSNEHEGGPSALKNSEDVGFNVAVELTWGLDGVGTAPMKFGSNRAGDPMYATEGSFENPFDRSFADASSGKGRFVLGSGLEFIQKGSKFGNGKTRLNYLGLHGDVLYDYALPNGASVFGGLGPYIAYGLGGKSGNGSEKVSSFGGDDGYKRFDAGLHLTAGYRLKSSLRLSLGYEYGLVNKSPAPDFTSRNRTLSLNVGYSLDKIVGVFQRKK